MKVDIGNYPIKGKRRCKVRITGHDTYNLCHTLALVILPALKKFKEHGSVSIPGSLFSASPRASDAQKTERACKKWEEIIDKMIIAFEMIVLDDYDPSDKKECKKVKDGLRLFAKYYESLWW